MSGNDVQLMLLFMPLVLKTFAYSYKQTSPRTCNKMFIKYKRQSIQLGGASERDYLEVAFSIKLFPSFQPKTSITQVQNRNVKESA